MLRAPPARDGAHGRSPWRRSSPAWHKDMELSFPLPAPSLAAPGVFPVIFFLVPSCWWLHSPGQEHHLLPHTSSAPPVTPVLMEATRLTPLPPAPNCPGLLPGSCCLPGNLGERQEAAPRQQQGVPTMPQAPKTSTCWVTRHKRLPGFGSVQGKDKPEPQKPPNAAEPFPSRATSLRNTTGFEIYQAKLTLLTPHVLCKG